MKKIEVCGFCHEKREISARGLCSSCYPKLRVAGELYRYPMARDAWKDSSDLVIELYKNGSTSSDIAIAINRSDATVRNILKRMCVPRRRTGYARKIGLNENAFDNIESEESAYWLGFIYADGYVGRYRLSVHLSERDFGHIQKLLLFLGSPSKVRRETGGKAAGNVYSAYMARKLNEIGIIVNRGRFDNTLNALSPEIYRHFIRGYIDGDGSLYLSNGSPCLKVIGQADIVQWIDSTISSSVGSSRHLMYKTKSEKVIETRYCGKLQATAIANFLYDNSFIYLDRKFEIYKSWKEIYSDDIAKSPYHNCCSGL